MYGKHFESMYEGSMYGAGVAVFAVWGFVISHARDGRVELHPRRLADTLGGTVEEINQAIEFLMRPDPISRNKEAEGRRLVREGEFQYMVPSWEHYYRIKNEEDRREYNRVMKQRERARKKEKKQKAPRPVETTAERLLRNGDEHTARRLEELSAGEPPSMASQLNDGEQES